MISDYLPIEECGMLSYKIFLTLPSYRVVEVETPKYEQFLTGFTIKDIDNRP